MTENRWKRLRQQWISARWIRGRYLLATAAILLICGMNAYVNIVVRVVGNDQCRWVDKGYSHVLVTDIVPGGVADKAGLKDGDILIRIDGESFRTSQEAQLMINHRAGTETTYEIERGGERMVKRILILRSLPLLYIAQLLYGLGFLIVGLVVIMVKPQGQLQRMFARYSVWSMLLFGLAQLNIDPGGDPTWRTWIIATAFLVATVGALPTFVRFYLLFPVRWKFFDRRWFTVTLYVASTLIALVFLLSLWVELARRMANVFFYVRYGFYLTGLIIFIFSFVTRVEPKRRQALRPVLIGVALGIVTFVYALVTSAVNPFAVFLNPTLILPVMILVVVPLTFGYAIFRYGLMDVDLLVRRTLTYGALTASLAAIYLLVVSGVGNLLGSLTGVRDDHIFDVAALMIIAIAFEPIKERLKGSIDRTFYREQYDYQKALLELSEQLPRLIDPRQILDALVARLAETVHIDRLAVITNSDGGAGECAARGIDPADCRFPEGEQTLRALLQRARRPLDLHAVQEGWESLELDTEERQRLARAGVVLTVPMFQKDRLVGFINVGPKLSGSLYSQEDLNLLSTVAAQAATAIENARLMKSEREKVRISEELSLAREIQKGLLPKGDPVVRGLDIAGVSLPALSVGGDYYDFIPLAQDRLLVVIGDVSGKGMSAALYMSKIQGMVQLAAHMYRSPKDMLVHINRRIFEGIDRRSFITMILALFDLKKRQVVLCRAGHTKALVGRGAALRPLDASGIALGLERGPVFEEQIEEVRVPIRPDSIFVFYTDGVTEVMNEHNAELGERAVLELVRSHRDQSAKAIRETVLARVDAFRGASEPADDITLVVVKGEPAKKAPATVGSRRKS